MQEVKVLTIKYSEHAYHDLHFCKRRNMTEYTYTWYGKLMYVLVCISFHILFIFESENSE